MKKAMALFLAAAMTVSALAGCGGGGGGTTAAASESAGGTAAANAVSGSKENAVVIGMDADPGTFNPWGSTSTALLRLKWNVFQPLFYLNTEKELIPILAESYEQVDATHYTVRLKQNIKDSAGNPIKASDVVFSMQQAADGPMANTFKYADPSTFQAVDDYTASLEFLQETEYAFTSVVKQIPIVSEAAYKADPNEMVNMPVGTGPYVLSDWTVGSSLTFTKNADYWDTAPTPMFSQNMDEITYRIISEGAQRAIELETGAIDIMYDCQATDLSRFQNNDAYVADIQDGSKVLNCYFNCSDNSPCADVRIRQAIAYAIDSQAVAVAACEGLGNASFSIAHPVTMEWREAYRSEVLYPQNIEKAKSLLSEAGYQPGELTISIMADETAIKRASAQIIQAACSEIGINVEIQQLESAVFQANIGDRTAWDAYMGVNQSEIYAGALMTTQIEKTGYTGKELLDAIDKAFTVYDEATSDAAVQLWDQEIPILPLVNVQQVYVYKAGLKNVNVQIDTTFWPGEMTWE